MSNWYNSFLIGRMKSYITVSECLHGNVDYSLSPTALNSILSGISLKCVEKWGVGNGTTFDKYWSSLFSNLKEWL